MLFSLIKSLSSAEKRYFKLFANTYAKPINRHIELFNLIDSQNKYEAQSILNHFKNIKQAINLNADKEYLYKMIMSALQAYYKNFSPKIKIRNLIEQSEIAQHKNLVKSTFRLINRARNLAIKHEEFSLLIELYEIEKKATVSFYGASKMKDFIDNNARSFNKIFDKMKNLYAYYQISDQCSFYLKLTKKEDKEKWRNVCFPVNSNGLLKDESMALTVRAKNIFYLVHALNANLDDNFEQVYQITKKWKDTLEEKIQIISSVSTLDWEMNTMYLSSCIRLQKRNEFEKGIGLIKSNKEIFKKRFELICNLEIYYYGVNKLYKQGSQKIMSLEQGILDMKKDISFSIFANLMLNIVQFYFDGAFYKNASNIINEVLLDKESSKVQDIYIVQLRIFNLIVLYELGEHLMLSSQAITTKYYLMKSKNWSKINSNIVNLFLLISKQNFTKQFNKKLLEVYTIIKQNVFENEDLENKDFMLSILNWLKLKLNK